MRAHQVDAALGFLLAHAPQGGEHALRLRVDVDEVGAGRVARVGADNAVDGGVKGEPQVARRVRDVVIGARGRLLQARGDGRARGRDARRQRGELLVPHLQRRQVGGLPAAKRGLGGLQERGTLSGDAIEVGAHGRMDGGELRGEVVEEGASHRRVAAHEREILGGEHNGAYDAQDLAGPHLRAVDARPVCFAAHDLQLDDLLATRGHDPRADDGAARGGLGLVEGDTHERALRADPVRRECRQVGEGLDEVRLALAVRAHQDCGSRGQLDDPVLPGAEVVEGQVGDAHVRCRSGWASAGSGTA